MLQKFAEVMEYHNLLVEANHVEDEALRLIYVSTFILGQYHASATKRVAKPFNPILGETFELESPEFRYFAEQVQHHPPVSACYAYNKNHDYQYWSNSHIKTQFWGSSLEIIPIGLSHVVLNKFHEEYIISRPNSTAHNIIFGNIYIEHSGKLICEKISKNNELVPAQERLKLTLEFKRGGWTRKNMAVVSGSIPVRPGSRYSWQVQGKWTDKITATNEETGQAIIVWQANPLPHNSAQMYHLTHFALQLNYRPDNLLPLLPPTDSRLRPDQRALEQGELELATKEKHRLEEKQRHAGRLRQERNEQHKAKYFEQIEDQDTGEVYYKFSRDYWQDREKLDWQHLDNLFSDPDSHSESKNE